MAEFHHIICLYSFICVLLLLIIMQNTLWHMCYFAKKKVSRSQFCVLLKTSERSIIAYWQSMLIVGFRSKSTTAKRNCIICGQRISKRRRTQHNFQKISRGQLNLQRTRPCLLNFQSLPKVCHIMTWSHETLNSFCARTRRLYSDACSKCIVRILY